ncbi:MAG TPA: AMP-binding protein, partial [bacterium]|nr:AMP-binding protein [bacterium]
MTAGPALVGRVREALEAADSVTPTGGEGVARLVRATREAIAELVRARRETDESAPGHVIELRSLLHRILDRAVERRLRLAVLETPFAREWTDLLIEAVQVADYTVGSLFLGRARHCGDRTLFLLSPRHREGRISWARARERVMAIARALVALRRTGEIGPEQPVALLGANSAEIALFDLACLVSGTRNVPVPANSPPPQVRFILEHARAGALFLGDDVSARVALDGIGAGGP